MKKKRNFLTIISSFLGLAAICGIFACSVIDHNKNTQVGAVPTQIQPSSADYRYYHGVDGNFYFDTTFLTYNTDIFNNSNQSRFYRQVTGTINNLNGLYFLFDDVTNINAGDIGLLTVDFVSYYYSSIQNQVLFSKFNKMWLSGTSFRWYFSDNSYYDSFVKDSSSHGTWGSDKSKGILFLSSGTSSNLTNWVNWFRQYGDFYEFYEIRDVINQNSSLQSQVSTLESQVSSLTTQNSSLQNQVSSLNSQLSQLQQQYNSVTAELNSLRIDYASALDEISTLEGEVSSLQTQLNSAVSTARQYTYVVDVKCQYQLTFDAYVKIDTQELHDWYILPLSLKVTSSIDVFDCAGNLEEYHQDIVDTFSFSSITPYFYSYSDLYSLLYIEMDVDDWLLQVPFQDLNDYNYFDLTNINGYLDDWLLDFKTDISTTSNTYFQKAVDDYCLLIGDFLSANLMSYQDGLNQSYDTGYSQGKIDGESIGFANGIAHAQEQNSTVVAIFNGILKVAMVPVNFFLAIFNFNILGVNLSAFIRALFTVILTVIVLKTVLGNGGGSSDN